MSKRRFARWVGFVLGTAIVAALGFFGARLVVGGGTTAATAGVTSPDQLRISAKGSDFSNEMLHWVEFNDSYTERGPDKANGVLVTTDIWVKYGSDDVPVALRSVSRSPEGEILQASLLTSDGGLVDLQPNGCREIDRAAAQTSMSGIRPMFVDFELAKSVGLKETTRPAADVPPNTSDLVVDAAPDHELTQSSIAWYELEYSDENENIQIAEELDTGGLRLAESVDVTNAKGDLTYSRRTSWSSIEVYKAESIGQSIFTRESLPEGACR